MPNDIALVPSKATRVVELEGIVDGYPSETFSLTTNVGTSPLEDGSSITDHAVAMPEASQLAGRVRGLVRAEEALAEIRRLQSEVEPMTIVSPFGVFREMLLKSCAVERKGDALEFSFQFEQVLRVGLTGDRIVAPVAGPALGRTDPVERGRQNPEPEPDPLEELEELEGAEKLEEAVAAEEADVEEEEEEEPRESRRSRFKRAMAKVNKAVGDARKIISNAAAMKRAFDSRGVLGLLAVMDERLMLPPPLDGAVGRHSRSALMLAAAGRNGLRLARALEDAGADDLTKATHLAGASQNLGRRLGEAFED